MLLRARMKQLLVLILLVAGTAGAYYAWGARGSEVRPNYRRGAVKQSDLIVNITATGTVEPEEVVDVGAQVAGRIEKLGQDPQRPGKTIDYGSEVEQGTVLAQIDGSVYRSHVEQAKANLQRAEADLLQLQAKLYQAQRDWKRAQSLKANRTISDADYDLSQANEQVARSALAVGKATVTQTKSALHLAEINLSYTTIRSPVKGVIIDRRVNVGQTVVASLNAPSMFLIAKDLARMQVWAAVNEADIGRIHKGQPVRFTVDAYPEQMFEGQVAQIRLNATMTQNVVTYTVVIVTENADRKLLPYLTANLQFQLARQKNVLLVPNSALRWQPRPELVLPEASGSHTAVSTADNTVSASEDGKKLGTIWVEQAPYVRPVQVAVGLSDGLNTEISGSSVRAGMQIVLGEQQRREGTATTNPFAPRMFGNSKGGSQ